MRNNNTLVWNLASIVLTIVAWETVVFVFQSPLLPSFIFIAKTFFLLVVEPNVYSHLFASVSLVVKGFLLSLVFALPTSLLSFRINIFAKIILPIHEFIRYIPVPAFVPLCAVLFGVGDTTKIVLIFIGTYFQLIFLFIANFASQPKEIEESAKTLGLRGISLINKIIIRGSLADLLTTIRITFAWAWSYLLVAEVINARRGIGYLVLQAYRVLDMERLLALLIIIGLFGVLADTTLRIIRKILCPWSYVVVQGNNA